MEEHENCPICFEIPSQEIYQCVGGHTICHICVTNLLACPQCRVPYGAQKIRNRVLEQILDKQTFDCVNALGGCKEKLKRQDILKHAESCSKRPISLCKMLGYEHCTYVLDPSNRSAIIKHLTEEHGIVNERTTEVSIWHANFKSTLEACNHSNKIWNPTLLTCDADWGKGSLFLITGFVDGIRKSVSWNCLQICGVDKESSFEAKFTLKNAVTEATLLTWMIPVLNVLTNGHDYNDLLRISPCEVSFSFINKICENISDVPVSVQIQQSTQLKKGGQLKNPVEVWTYSTDTNTATVLDHASSASVSHSGVECDGCRKKPIIGKRHKCLQCEDYDLCETCIAVGIHDHHIFAGLATIEQAQEFRSVLSAIRLARDENRQIQDVAAQPNPSIICPNITCDGCRVRNFAGNQYKCLLCPDYDLCESCKSSGIHSAHIFIIVTTFEQRQLIRQSFPRIRIRIPGIQLTLLQIQNARGNVTDNGVVCPNVVCDECRTSPIRGIQYKCLQCPDYDVCGTCLSRGSHSFHIFITISSKFQRDLIRQHFVQI